MTSIKLSEINVSYKGEELTRVTKLRLEMLGINPSAVNTEAQAQLIIAQLEGAQKRNGTDSQQQGGTQQGLISEAKQLAQQIGVSVFEGNSLEDILENISETLQSPEYPVQSVQESQEKLADIAQRANITINVQKNIFNQMNMISISNRLILGL